MKKILLFIWILLQVSPVQAQQNERISKHLTVREGLSHKAATNITQLYIKKIMPDFVHALGFQIKEANNNL